MPQPTASWDPLVQQQTEELVGATIKRQIKNILKSYTGWYDPFSELIQNAIDATDARAALGEDGYVPRIWVEINLRDNLICVTDNGIGFKESEFKSFLSPNISFKRGNTRGNKGVGATYLAYGFNFLQIGTKTSEFSFTGTIKGGREWVEDSSGTVSRPMVVEDDPLSRSFQDIDKGSTFVIKFSGNFIRPKDLKYFAATNANQWEVILRTKTPLGGVYFDRMCLLKSCDLTVISEDGASTNKSIIRCEYLYPHEVISSTKELREIVKIQKEMSEKGTPASKLPAGYTKLNGLFNFWETEELLNNSFGFKTSLTPDQKKLIKDYKIRAYGFQCYTTQIWDKFNDDVVQLRKGYRILKGGVQLATNNMIQGEALIIPLKKNIGLQNVTSCLIHFSNADPDLGRKGFQPELTELGQEISEGIVKALWNWNSLLRKETGASPDIQAQKEVHDWVREQEEHEKKEPLLIKKKDFFLPLREPAITSKPGSEQDAISLFNQLLAGGVIRGVKLLATSANQRYDGVYRIFITKPLENHVFDSEKNPLGIEKDRIVEQIISHPMILEYKFNFDYLLDDIDNEIKNEKDIRLVVAWTMGEHWATRYEIIPLLLNENIHHRSFHGETHIIRNSKTGEKVFSAIILDELIDFLNDPKKAQEVQKQRYVDNRTG